ncbi:heparanase [Leptinotarsa decemlineata]|uniref:heparanase n=1 Tax=Leptinotarsa decemlineata TaxID=7539 RepID=UPI003D307B08
MVHRLEEKFLKYHTFASPAKICIVICISLVLTILSMYIIFTSIIPKKSSTPIQEIFIESKKRAHFRTSSKFLSVTLDSFVIAMGFKNFNTTNMKLIRMMQYLSPGYLRVGGTLADKLYFSTSDQINENVQNFYETMYDEGLNNYNIPNYTMTDLQWLQLTKLAENAGLEIFFDLNSLIRFRNGSWDYRNARNLIEFSNYHKLKVNWELGNEPNSFEHKFNEVVNATQMARDFALLRKILNKYPFYKNSLLIGPDVTRPQKNHKESELYLEEFLQNSVNTINAITWHQYYINGRTAQAQDFLNPKIFDYLKHQIKDVKEIVKSSPNRKADVYLGETSSAYGGGAPNLSDSFIGSFIWADKLGLAAKMGVRVVMRQSIFHGNYALLDNNYDPNPDWWLSVLHKKLIGEVVVPYHTITSPYVRLYVYCTKRALFERRNNSITIMGMNLVDNVAKIRINGLLSDHFEAPSEVYSFELTSEALQSKSVLLNGKPLKMLPNNTLPIFVPVLKRLTPFVTMSPQSIAFWVIPNTNVMACL